MVAPVTATVTAIGVGLTITAGSSEIDLARKRVAAVTTRQVGMFKLKLQARPWAVA